VPAIRLESAKSESMIFDRAARCKMDM